jgi:signal transduction histidine kinase
MRQRLVLAIAGIATGAVVLLAVPLAIVIANGYRDRDLLRLQRDAVSVTRRIDRTGARDPVELPPSKDVLGVYDAHGRLVVGHGPPGTGLVDAVLRGARVVDETGDGRLVVGVPLLAGERVSGVVRVERSDRAGARDVRRAWLLIAAVSLGIIGAATAAAVLVARRLALPLERLADDARRLGDGDFSVPPSAQTGVAELDAVGTALDTTARRLDELLTRERAFSADASHQLRTPLQALRIELEAVELRGDAPPEVPAALTQVDRLQTTIDTLLAVARDAPRRDVTTDLAEVIEAVAGRWREPLATAGRPLRLAAPVHAVAQASPDIVGEILEVLLANAYAHGAGPVGVTVRELEGHYAVDVSDEGPGLGDEPERAFARRAGDGAGHGIGLALARSLAAAEGGRLVVTRSGPGAVLTLLVERRVQPETAAREDA